MMQINWQGQSKRKKRAYLLWKQFVDEYNSGKSAQEIADSYVNPKTGKNYTRAHVYWVLQQMKNIKMSELQKAAQTAKPYDLEKEEIKTLVKSSTPKGQDPIVWYTLVRDKMGVVPQGPNQGKPWPAKDVIQFIYVCFRTGLDPIVGQIYAVHRWNNKLGDFQMTIQAGIDGMRLAAQRNGNYAGQDDAIFEPLDENTKAPRKASVTIYKIVKSHKVPFTATARWGEYAQIMSDGKLMGMWEKMPYNQLSKCAESLALRKGFPNELSGIYSEDEMAQASNI